MRTLRLAWKLPAVAVVTAFCAFVPFLVRLLTFGALRPHAWAGAYGCMLWGKAVCAIFRVRIRLEGSPPRGLFVVAANHLSYLDILVLGSLYPSLFVAKREIRSWPLFGWIARGSGTLFVDRDRPKDVVRAGREMVDRLAAGIPLTLFPEGKSTPGREVLPFLSSLLEPAAKAGVPCYAVSLTYRSGDIDDLPPSVSVCWYDGSPFAEHAMRLMRHRRIDARVRFAPAPVVSDDRKVLARELFDFVAGNFEPVRQATEGRA